MFVETRPTAQRKACKIIYQQLLYSKTLYITPLQKLHTNINYYCIYTYLLVTSGRNQCFNFIWAVYNTPVQISININSSNAVKNVACKVAHKHGDMVTWIIFLQLTIN